MLLASGAWALDVKALTDAAARGDADAAMSLGTAYDLGDGVPADPRAALRWYEVAAGLGNVSAMFNVGVMYDTGTGTVRDRSRAAHWYEQAAAHGHARAAYDLGLLYEEGEGVRRNLATAARWYKRAAAEGLTAGDAKVAALAPLLRANTANADYVRAQTLIEDKGLTAAAPEMLPLLRRAAVGGYPVAQYDLGYLYENGLGVPTDRVQAYVWYRRAATAARAGGGRDAAVITAATAGATRLAARLDPTEKADARAALRATR
ncbi:tetratricopeptide repeat protein [Acidisphaera rubrifaciens]|nr:tetratricopeptide repeat protein [Acidisphaera rubrifaciens]